MGIQNFKFLIVTFIIFIRKLETLELQKPQEESPRADGQSAGDIVFGRLAGIYF